MGELILGRGDDGTLSVIRADDEIQIAEDLVADIPNEGDYRLEGKVLKIDTDEGLLAYVLTEYFRDTHVWRAVRTKDIEGKR